MDIVFTIPNLGTKLMRWISSFDCDRVGVSSLTVCQCSDEGEVRSLDFASSRGVTVSL